MVFSRISICIVLGCLIAACGPGSLPQSNDSNSDHASDSASPCTSGAARCDGTVYQRCDGGVWVEQASCPQACTDALGCVACSPGTGMCDGAMSSECRADGSGYDQTFCDPLQGMECDPGSGRCTGACAPRNLGMNYIGCEYYPTITANDVDNLFEFAVVISNTSDQPASIHIEGGALTTPLVLSVQPARVAVQPLPWHPTLKGCNSMGQLECGPVTEPSALVQDGAYHLRSDQPVTVYQFNPLDYELSQSCTCNPICHGCSFTNDASLLLPANALTGNYYVASYGVWPGGLGTSPGLMAITATADDTQVVITSRAPTRVGTGVPALTVGVPQTITMNQGDAVQFMAKSGDFTGSAITATRPVQVIGAHYCTQIPFGTVACDHIEESIFPLETLGNRYIVTAPMVAPLPNGKPQVVRIIATEPTTTITYDPPRSAPTVIDRAGDMVEITNTADSFAVSADKKILVVQYMQGQGAGGDTGDPAMSLAIPVDQYRMDYQFHAPVNYESNFVNITAPIDAVITLDGVQVAGFAPIGNSGIGLLRAELSDAGSGDHLITGTHPFGIMVYGYGQYTSYWYPGGLDLATIVVE